MSDAVLRLDDVRRTYHLSKTVDVHALLGVTLEIGRGELVAIVGPSGSGKTTLLNLAGLLDHPDSGEVFLSGKPTSKLPERDRARMRRQGIGFIFQSFNLLPHLTAEENVALPLRYADSQPRVTPAQLLGLVGLGRRREHRPDQLSGGEQQRVAIARALMLNPPLLLCDEPTGELDTETAEGIHRILQKLRDVGRAVVVVTHNPELARIAGRTIHMRDGAVTDEEHAAVPVAPARRRRRVAKT